MNWYRQEEKVSAVEALSRAQKIAYAPMAFQAARLLCKFGILHDIEQSGQSGRTLSEISEATEISEYGADVLLSMGLSIGLVYKTDNRFVITKTGYFLMNDEMTRVNMAFTHDVCYQAMFHLEEAIKEGRPAGLKEFGDWENLYQGLTQLPERALNSWYDFDHFYSDGAFPKALPLVFADRPKTLFDVGGNTGKWSLACARYDEQVQISILDLPGQLERARKNIHEAGFSDRVKGVEIDLLDPNQLFPGQADAIWMSQFLDCFAPEEIVSILTRATAAMGEDSHLYIMETLWDQQEYEAASYSLNATSLYFTALANGNSRMYSEEQLVALIHQAGLEVVQQTNGLGFCHTLLKCRLARQNSLDLDI
ncbi:methyltransferase [Endozoicomonas atrinae]|uniref:methyltransferase n=1 Tax=Endozoicomonas atrinae TaxID=1333660 RepID=UPI0008269099|nr:class I SAM-dependent methyltransferase [Endozoicomonas atrinae]